MSGSNITHRRRTYTNDPKEHSAAIDVHHVTVQQSNLKISFISLLAFTFAANGFYLFLVLEKSPFVLLWSLVLSSIFLKLVLGRSVVKESVLIMPGFGVQLETHYRSEQDSEAGAARATDSSHLLLDSMFDSTGGGGTNIDFQGAASTIEDAGSYMEGIVLCIWRQSLNGSMAVSS